MTIDEDDQRPKLADYVIGQQLETLSIEELEETIERLKGEIERIDEILGQKTRHRAAADALFGKK